MTYRNVNSHSIFMILCVMNIEWGHNFVWIIILLGWFQDEFPTCGYTNAKLIFYSILWIIVAFHLKEPLFICQLTLSKPGTFKGIWCNLKSDRLLNSHIEHRGYKMCSFKTCHEFLSNSTIKWDVFVNILFLKMYIYSVYENKLII